VTNKRRLSIGISGSKPGFSDNVGQVSLKGAKSPARSTAKAMVAQIQTAGISLRILSQPFLASPGCFQKLKLVNFSPRVKSTMALQSQ
jgi:hypothetical protein